MLAFEIGEEIFFHVNSRNPSTGALATITGGAFAFYRDDSTTESSVGLVASIDFDGKTGLHLIEIVPQLVAGKYTVIATAGTVAGTSIAGEVAGQFQVKGEAILAGVVGTVADQLTFEITSGPARAGAYDGLMVVLYDVSDNNAPSVRTVETYGAEPQIILDSAPDFTLVAGDRFAIYKTPPILVDATNGLAAIRTKLNSVPADVLAATNGGDTVGGQLQNLDAQVSDAVSAASSAGIPTDTETEPVHSSRIFVLKATAQGLRADSKTIIVGEGDEPQTYGIDFRNDAAANQKVFTVESITVTDGDGDDVTITNTKRQGTMAVFRMAVTAADSYTIRAKIKYKDGNYSQGDAPFTAVD